MDLEIIILSEVSQKEKDRYHMISLTWNLKYETKELTKQEQIHRLRKQTYGYQKGKWRRDKLDKLKVWDKQKY